MSNTVFTFKALVSRRIPDPTFPGCVRHIFLCRCEDMPEGLPKGANPREQNIDRGIYRDIMRSLLNEDCTPNTFHLKNKGITILAEEVIKSDNDEQLQVRFAASDQGIVDGGHTYEIILRGKGDIADLNSAGDAAIKQYVKVEVLTGVYNGLTAEIAGGLNTAVQVQRMSLADLGKEFDWIKEELQKKNFLQHVAFKQNEAKDFDARDIIRLLDLFNISEFPNNGTSYPIRAYTSKEGVLKHYLTKEGSTYTYVENYKKLSPILNEILILHDTISAEGRDLYNEGGGRRGGRLKFIESGKLRTAFKFPFISDERQYRLSGGALLPMLGAFRAAVNSCPVSNKISWNGGFDHVLSIWRETARDLMEATQETSEELGRNPNAIGKSKKHWAFLHHIALRRFA
jgi:hypothetical protein